MLRSETSTPLGYLFSSSSTRTLEAGFGCRRGDQLNDRAIAAQRFASPVDRDEREETVLDLVPFTGAGWQVTHRDGLSSSVNF
jgi:hypothetical protein